MVVDFESYYKYNPNKSKIGDIPILQDIDICQCTQCKGKSVLEDTYKTQYDYAKGAEAEWSDLQTMLFPPRVLGYVISEPFKGFLLEVQSN